MFSLSDSDENEDLFQPGNDNFLDNVLNTKKPPHKAAPITNETNLEAARLNHGSNLSLSPTEHSIQDGSETNSVSHNVLNLQNSDSTTVRTLETTTPKAFNATTTSVSSEIIVNSVKRISPTSPKHKWGAKRRLLNNKLSNITPSNNGNDKRVPKRQIPGPAGLFSRNQTTSPSGSISTTGIRNAITFECENESWQQMMLEFSGLQRLIAENNIATIINKYKSNNIERGRVPSILIVTVKEICDKVAFATNAILQDKTGVINAVIYGKQGDKLYENLDAGSTLFIRGASIFTVNQKDVKDKRYYISFSHKNIVCVYQGRERISRFNKEELGEQIRKKEEEILIKARVTKTTSPKMSFSATNSVKPQPNPVCVQQTNINPKPNPVCLQQTNINKDEESFLNDEDDFDKMFKDDDFDELMKDSAVDDFMANLIF